MAEMTDMHEENRPYLESCPVGCPSPLVPTDIILAEGPLLRCAGCGQLVSQCSGERYRQSMAEFDDPRGTLPGSDSTARHTRRARKCLAGISRLLQRPPEGTRLLDVGCSTGAFITVADRVGFAAEGVEPAPQAARSAQAAGLRVRQGLLEEVAFPDQAFDVVTLFEVIEHVREILPLFRECRRILKREGLLVIGTGNADSWAASFMRSRWEYFHIERHGGHVSFFNPHSIRLLADRSGFQIESLKTHSMRFYEKGDVHPIIYRLAKIASELMNLPSHLFGKGHDMQVFLRRL
jgi:2-polyprenyl-3-methyl-5-hydroxy-6-metoxy-1,4-benzoquinol methylase